jgi:hypothetical protein
MSYTMVFIFTLTMGPLSGSQIETWTGLPTEEACEINAAAFQTARLRAWAQIGVTVTSIQYRCEVTKGKV